MEDSNDFLSKYLNSEDCNLSIYLLDDLINLYDYQGVDNMNAIKRILLLNKEKNKNNHNRTSNSSYLASNRKNIDTQSGFTLNNSTSEIQPNVHNDAIGVIPPNVSNFDLTERDFSNVENKINKLEIDLIKYLREDIGSWNIGERFAVPPEDYCERQIIENMNRIPRVSSDSKVMICKRDSSCKYILDENYIKLNKYADSGCHGIKHLLSKIRLNDNELDSLPLNILYDIINNGNLERMWERSNANNSVKSGNLLNTARLKKLSDLNLSIDMSKNEKTKQKYVGLVQKMYSNLVVQLHEGLLEKYQDLSNKRLCYCDTHKQKEFFLRKFFNNKNIVRNFANKNNMHNGKLYLWMGEYSIPRNDKRSFGGEDGWFISESNQCMGVADGVGEWEELSGKSSKSFADFIMKSSLYEINKFKQKDDNLLSPSERVKLALSNSLLECDKSGIHGACTSLVMLFDNNTNTIAFGNMGDSSGLVLRRLSYDSGRMDVVRRVKEMQHSFNCPYQFAKLPKKDEWNNLLEKGYRDIVYIAQMEEKNQKNNYCQVQDSFISSDKPEHIELLEVKGKVGDLIIIGSDGLFDNLFDIEISTISGLFISPSESKTLYNTLDYSTTPMSAAKCIALSAYHKSIDPTSKTPFANQAKKYCMNSHSSFQGGKEDDISVLVAWIVTEDDIPRLNKTHLSVLDIDKR